MQEQPHFKRSALWQKERQITAWLQEGYSFRQIADELTRQGTKVSMRWLQEWYAKNVGRRRTRPQITPGSNANQPPSAPARSAGAATAKVPDKAPSPAIQASRPASATDTDFSALFQSQFRRPRK